MPVSLPEHRIRAPKYTNATWHRQNQFEITPVCPHKQHEVGATLTGDKTIHSNKPTVPHNRQKLPPGKFKQLNLGTAKSSLYTELI